MQYLTAIARTRTFLRDEMLPYHELKEVLSVLSGRVDGDLAKRLTVRFTDGERGGCSGFTYLSW